MSTYKFLWPKSGSTQKKCQAQQSPSFKLKLQLWLKLALILISPPIQITLRETNSKEEILNRQNYTIRYTNTIPDRNSRIEGLTNVKELFTELI